MKHLLVVLLCVFVMPAHGATGKATSPFRLIDHTETSWTYDYVPSPLLPQYIIIDGVPHRLYNGTETVDNAGQPLLPTEAITFGVPFNFSITAELADATYAEEQGVFVAPSATYARSEEGEAIPSYVKDSEAYGQNLLFPSKAIQVEDPYTVRYSRMATVRLSPIQYNPATRILRRLSHARLVVRLQPLALAKAAPVPVTASDPHFEPEYRSLMANYGDATAWRYRAPSTVEADSTGAWFAAGDAFIRLPVAQDGWYRVTLGDLAAFGVAPPALDTSTVKVYFKGQQVPLYIGADMSMHFYGLRKCGDSTYLDYYTDTSAYWLSWQKPGTGLRYNAVPDLNITPADTEFASRSTVHLEENKDYYEGTGDAEVTLNGQAAGEGWTWDYFYPGTTLEYEFALDNVWTTGDSAATLRARLFSTTRNYNTPDHIARFWVNDSLLGEKSFQGRTQGLFLVSFPRAWLKEGANRLKIQSVTTASSPNQFYLDWFEVEYVRTHVAQNGRLICSVAPRAGLSEARISARGFASAAIHVLDMTSGRKLQDISVTMEAGGTYAVVFDDTLTVARQYLIVEDASASPVAGASRKTFSGLRQNTSGADYIILTHGLFRSAANTLAAHRQSHNGVRTAVVDVQDIYDEFNFGHLSSESIKSFLRHAFDNWPSPAPAYVLMFGDASWDFHRYMATTIMTNYVPAYGVPSGDNWFVCFDSIRNFLPSLKIGRLPVQSPDQAAAVVDKVIGYDSYTLADWNKNFLFISGGTTPSERLSFDGQSNAMVQDFILPAPIGGTPFSVYKTTPNAIDGEHRETLRALVRDGLVFVNFLGHSGGRVWGVDIGPPGTLENTTGMLPLVTSVSCNVAAFAEPSSNVLSEDFVLADHRGAVAMWASSSLGYANVGAMLVRYFLEAVCNDTARVLSETIAGAMIKMWQARGSDFVTLASMNLNPLLGDPLTSLAIPQKPDLAITQADLGLDVVAPTPMDTTIHVKMVVHNYGLVPGDSVAFSMTDVSANGVDSVANAVRIRPTPHRDTVLVPWSGTSVTGSHVLQVTMDPAFVIDEVTKANNSAALATYVFAHSILAVRPLHNEAVPPGAVELVVTSPVSGDTSITAFEFELDMSPTFTSSFRVTSGQVQSGPVGGRWATPVLSAPGAYFWRARTVVDTLVGKWVTGHFLVEVGIPTRPLISWREKLGAQFSAGIHGGTMGTDSGLTLRTSPPLEVAVRSLGYRANSDKDFYSTIRINEQRIYGLWWEHGSSFMVARLNAFSGTYDFKAFNVAGNAALADSMINFLGATANGDYLLLTVIFDGYSNVSEALRASIRSLGSTKIDSVLPGHSWMLIARKQASPPYFALEKWSPDGEAADSTIIPNNYAVGNGIYTSIRNPFPTAFEKLRWTPQLTAGVHTLRAVVLGIKPGGGVDSLASITSAETEEDLSGLTPAFADSLYTHIGIAATFGTNDALTTPTLREWSMDFAPPPDLAISGRTVGARTQTLAKGTAIQIPLTIHNIGYQPADSVRIRVDLIGSGGQAQPIHYATAGAIPVDSSSTVNLSIPSDGLTGYNLLDIVVSPPARARDLLAENNHAQVLINFTGAGETLAATVRMYADGVALMDGDYVSSRPQFLVQFEDLVGIKPGQERVRLWADNQLVDSESHTAGGLNANMPGGRSAAPATATIAGPASSATAQSNYTADGFIFSPQLSNGPHELVVRLYRVDSLAGLDSLERRIAVQVVGDLRIMRVYNYPNPFSSSTEFTFVLSGARPPEGLTIRIFTITGRRIQEITVPPTDLRVGFNRIWWDGRDRDGDEIANGYYFYKIQVEGEGKVETAIEKMAKVR